MVPPLRDRVYGCTPRRVGCRSLHACIFALAAFGTRVISQQGARLLLEPLDAMQQMFAGADPKTTVRKWKSEMRKEQRTLDRQIRGVHARAERTLVCRTASACRHTLPMLPRPQGFSARRTR